MPLGTQEDFEGALKPSSIEKTIYEADLFASRTVEIPSNMKSRYGYDASKNLIYIGYAPKGLDEGADGWLLVKFTYDASNQCTEKNIAYGNWTNKTVPTYN